MPYVSHVVLFLADAGNEAHGVPKSPQNLGFAAKSARSVACVTFRRKCDKMRQRRPVTAFTEGDAAIHVTPPARVKDPCLVTGNGRLGGGS